ncbi:thrombin-like enzyme batroxobin [Striga asiatica]|uniref:Thrombin-like enzyme batroxobin n=1 Tax=Striga asiatica TaxID=4170 RepID=A0A5A7R6M4_STRAF|nr:thrombin-like enzyme batroxobin [Striga asiatica]
MDIAPRAVVIKWNASRAHTTHLSRWIIFPHVAHDMSSLASKDQVMHYALETLSCTGCPNKPSNIPSSQPSFMARFNLPTKPGPARTSQYLKNSATSLGSSGVQHAPAQSSGPGPAMGPPNSPAKSSTIPLTRFIGPSHSHTRAAPLRTARTTARS